MPGPFFATGALADLELATLTPQLGRYFGTDKGVLVVRAPAGGALKLQDGDVILAIDGREPTSGSHVTRILASYQPGEKVILRIVRDRKTVNLEAILPERAGDGRGRTRNDREERGGSAGSAVIVGAPGGSILALQP
jgi:S1-C subfamily serine protease